jgi:hypothetical protein
MLSRLAGSAAAVMPRWPINDSLGCVERTTGAHPLSSPIPAAALAWRNMRRFMVSRPTQSQAEQLLVERSATDW